MTGIYVRQSIDKKDSLSIEGQIQLCLPEAGKEYKIYRDKGFSGRNINRPSFRKLMADVESGSVTKVVVYRLDRISRSIADFSQIWSKLEKKNVEFVSMNEKFDTSTPMGKAMLYIIMVFAQLERETIAERVRDNYYTRARTGSWVGGPAPFGFSVGKEISESRSIPVLVPNDAIDLVKTVFDEYRKENASLSTVARMLRDMEGKECSRNWDSVAVSRMLHNPVYVKCNGDIFAYYLSQGVKISNSPEEFDGAAAGMIVGKRDKSGSGRQTSGKRCFSLAAHRGVIEADIWLQCQYKLEKNKQLKNTGKGKYTWLTGLLKCGKCGYSLKVVCSRGKRYLVCSGKTNYHICDEVFHISLDEIERAAETELESMYEEADLSPVRQERRPPGFLKELMDIDLKTERLIGALSESSSITVSYINRELERLEEKKRELCLKREREEKAEFVFPQSLKWKQMDFDFHKMAAGEMLSRVNVYSDSVEFIWKI